MQGRRLPVIDGKVTMPERPGDYCGPVLGYSAEKPAVFFLLPTARDVGTLPEERSVHHVVSPPHVFTEEDDGTLTITASILSHTSRGPGWHGYLTRGEWSGG